MKINGLSFGINVVASGVKVSSVITEPVLVASSTKGSFYVSGAVSKALGLMPGDNIMFANDAADVEKAVINRVDAIVEFAQNNGFDLDTPEGTSACVAAITTWYIAKGVPMFKKTGEPIMVNVRLTKEEKKKYFDEHVDEVIKNNRDKLIAAYELAETATDEEIKAAFKIDDMPSPQMQSVSGCKLAASGAATGTGLKLSFSDTNNWEQLKSDLEDKTSMKRSFDVDIKNPIVSKYNNGKDDVDITFYALGEYKDEVPSRTGKKGDAEDAEPDAE